MNDSIRPGAWVACRWTVRVASIIVVLIGLAALSRAVLGWPSPGTSPWFWPVLRANSAAGVICAGLALGLLGTAAQHPSTWRAGQLLALLVTSLGLVTLAEYHSGRDLGIDHLLLRHPAFDTGSPDPGRPTPNAALILSLIGGALLGIGGPHARRRLSLALALGASFFTLIALVGYAYGARQLIGFPGFVPHPGMGVHATVTFALLCLGLLCVRPDQGPAAVLTSHTHGGVIARRLVGATLAVPLVIGLLAQALERANRFGLEVGFAIVTAATIVIGTSWLIVIAAWLDRADRERRRIEAALRESERRFRAIFDTTFQFIGLLSTDGTLLEANRTALDFGGLAPADVLGRPFWETRWWRISPATQERLRAAIAEAAQGRFVRYEVDVRGAGERVVTVDFSLKPVLDEGGQVVALIPEGRDITERKRAEEERGRLLERERSALAQAELERARLQAVLDSAPIGIVFADAASDRRLSNAITRQILGAAIDTPEERAPLLARVRQTDGSPLPPEETPTARALRGELVTGVEMLLPREDGRTVVLEVNAAPMRDPDGAVRGAVITFQDIAARKELERMRSEYLSLISHDLRAPLSGIMLQAELLRRRLGRAGNTEALENAETILRSSQQMNRLIQDLLDTTRLEAGRFQLATEPVDLCAFVSNTLDQTLSPEERSRIQFVLPPKPAYVPADPARLERVLVNLVSNALKYSQHDRMVAIHVNGEDGWVELSVIDHGQGIAAEDLPHVFEKFFRAQSVAGEGMGLGLYICRLLVEAHGGRLSVASVPGRGATFTVHLPEIRLTASGSWSQLAPYDASDAGGLPQ